MKGRSRHIISSSIGTLKFSCPVPYSEKDVVGLQPMKTVYLHSLSCTKVETSNECLGTGKQEFSADCETSVWYSYSSSAPVDTLGRPSS